MTTYAIIPPAYRATPKPRPYKLRGYGSAAPGGRVKIYGTGYAGAYPTAAAAFKALSITLYLPPLVPGGPKRPYTTWGGAAANPPARYEFNPPVGAYTPRPIAAYSAPVTVITVFSPATVRARLARRARGLRLTFYRVKGKRRVAATSLPPASYPRVAALGAPRGFSLAA